MVNENHMSNRQPPGDDELLEMLPCPALQGIAFEFQNETEHAQPLGMGRGRWRPVRPGIGIRTS